MTLSELKEKARLTDEERNTVYRKSYADALAWSEKYEVALSAKNWNPNRPADRERWFCTQHIEWITRDIAKAQLDKAYGDDFIEFCKERNIVQVVGGGKNQYKFPEENSTKDIEWRLERARFRGYSHGQQDMLKAGYKKVKPVSSLLEGEG